MKPYLKWTAISVGSIVAIAHIGVLGHLVRREPNTVQVPTINIPRGTPYSSYKIEAGKDGYTIEYKANDPAILESHKSLSLDKEKRGFLGGGSEKRDEHRSDQYTMEGFRNMGGEIGELGKSGGVSAECIAADAGARSQGAMAGSAVATGVLAPAVMNIPYIGWLAAGWTTLLGNNIGSAAGSRVNSFISDC
jgi:hypothetical protein